MKDPDEEWRRSLEWVIRKTRDALVAEGNFRPPDRADVETWIERLDDLRAEADRWRRLRHGVLDRDPGILDEVLTMRLDGADDPRPA